MATATEISPAKTPRHSSGVQQLQNVCAYVDVYSGMNIDPSTRHETSPAAISRWKGPNGFGCRHVNDHVPFSLWNDDKQAFRPASASEMRDIATIFNAKKVECHACHIVIATNEPPKPIPLTVACAPAIFVTPGEQWRSTYYASTMYANPRVADPCPHLAWGKMKTPSKSQMIECVSALTSLANIQRVHFFPHSIVVEIVFGDGRTYPDGSLPGVVAGLPTTYHHESTSFLTSMRSYTRERLMDPSSYLPGPQIGPLPQDGTNYLRELDWGILSPGVRVSTGVAADSGLYSPAVSSTTCGVLMRKGATKCVSVANHGFLQTNDVYHPAYDGDKIGDIIDRYPELDVAMVKLTPAHSQRFFNDTYFQAEPPRRLVESTAMNYGTWFEVDGMSTGLLSFLYLGNTMEPPVRPPGHPAIPVHQWRLYTISQIFGATNSHIIDGISGAPVVEERTGNVAGFFHSANGDFAICAALDDLIAEGWEVV